MRQISKRDFETYEKIKKFMDENELREEALRRYFKHEIHLKISSKGMGPSTFKSLYDVSTFISVSRQTIEHAHKHIRPLITRRKGGTKVFFIEWLESIVG